MVVNAPSEILFDYFIQKMGLGVSRLGTRSKMLRKIDSQFFYRVGIDGSYIVGENFELDL